MTEENPKKDLRAENSPQFFEEDEQKKYFEQNDDFFDFEDEKTFFYIPACLTFNLKRMNQN